QQISGTELLIIAFVLALGGGFLWRFAVVARSAEKQSAAPPNEHKTERAAAIPAKSIAVLPFENLSDDKSNAYFAEGVEDEIITRLAKIADLKVISRNSTKSFQSVPANLSEIAAQLGVANILEGSVQKGGAKIRATCS